VALRLLLSNQSIVELWLALLILVNSSGGNMAIILRKHPPALLQSPAVPPSVAHTALKSHFTVAIAYTCNVNGN